jgi:hypothetical protein
VAIVSVENTSRTDLMFNMVETTKERASQAQIIQGNEFHPSRGSEEKDESSPSVRGLALIQRATRETLMFPREIFLAGDATYSNGNHVLGSFDIADIDQEVMRDKKHVILKTGKQRTGIIIEPGSVLQNLYDSVVARHPEMVKSTTVRPDRKIELSWKDFTAINEHWKATHSKFVTKVDMTSLVCRIAPAGFTWEEFVNKLKDDYADEITEILNAKFVFKIGLSIDYMLGGHYLPGQVTSQSSSSSSSQQQSESSDSEVDDVNSADEAESEELSSEGTSSDDD